MENKDMVLIGLVMLLVIVVAFSGISESIETDRQNKEKLLNNCLNKCNDNYFKGFIDNENIECDKTYTDTETCKKLIELMNFLNREKLNNCQRICSNCYIYNLYTEESIKLGNC